MPYPYLSSTPKRLRITSSQAACRTRSSDCSTSCPAARSLRQRSSPCPSSRISGGRAGRTINASIIIQLLCIAIPALERLQKEGGEEGKKKIASITRYSTVAIGLLQGFAYYMMMRNYGLMNAAFASNIWAAIIVLTFTSGSALIMWLGEQITEFGIGNGISIILFVSIVARFPNSIIRQINNVANGDLAWWVLVLMYVGALLPADEGEYERRPADHLRPVDRVSAGHHLRLRPEVAEQLGHEAYL